MRQAQRLTGNNENYNILFINSLNYYYYYEKVLSIRSSRGRSARRLH